MLATSVVSQISAQDLFHTASIVQSRTFRDFEVYIVVAAVYLGAGAGLPPAVRRPLPAGLRPPMIRELTFTDVLYLIAATRWTLALTAIAFVGGGIVGLAVALLRVSPLAPLRWIGSDLRAGGAGHAAAGLAVRVLLRPVDRRRRRSRRGSPRPPSYSIYAGAFLGEIWRGCLQADPKTQWEAGASLGLSTRPQQLRYIIVPQATRLAIPPTVGFLVQLIKNTSLAAVIGFVELTREGQLTTADDVPSLHRLSHRGRALLRCSASR